MEEQMPPVGEVVEDQPKKNNTTLIIIAVVVVVLCCCCIGAWAAWNFGDAFVQELNF
ncbi:MAG TPA: hypothetical protein VLA72_15120 [Anaerolineales bacterium]|nr:hypothetical protein [Anaerolineales bacterium]